MVKSQTRRFPLREWPSRCQKKAKDCEKKNGLRGETLTAQKGEAERVRKREGKKKRRDQEPERVTRVGLPKKGSPEGKIAR